MLDPFLDPSDIYMIATLKDKKKKVFFFAASNLYVFCINYSKST